VWKAGSFTLLVIILLCSESCALFEYDGLSARYLSLGGGGTALYDEPSVMASNPGGLGFLFKKSVELSWSRLYNLKELSAGDFRFVFPLGKSLSINSLISGLGFNIFGESDYYQESMVSFAFGYKIKNYLSLGVSINYMRVSFPYPYSDFSAIGFDSGVLIRIRDKVQVGGAVKNLNQPEVIGGSDDVPRVWNMGVVIFPLKDIILTTDFAKESGFDSQLKFGQEIMILRNLALRLGIMTEPVRYGVGTGFNWEKMIIDYALLNHPALGQTHKVSLRFKW
jgi:hypothetical protein